MSSPILILDTASPIVSVAVASDGHVLAERTTELRRSSERLLTLVEEVLEEAGLDLDKMAGVAALQGPGSFTGLRIGLGTVLGFHQALGIPATALPTLPVIAAATAPQAAIEEATQVSVWAAVDAMRGDWSVQPFRIETHPRRLPEPLGDAELRSGKTLAELGPGRLAGFGIQTLAESGNFENELELVEPPPLAPVAARLLSREEFTTDPARLTRPIYFRPPAVTVPKR